MRNSLVTNNVSKHIDLRFHMIRDHNNTDIYRLNCMITDHNCKSAVAVLFDSRLPTLRKIISFEYMT